MRYRIVFRATTLAAIIVLRALASRLRLIDAPGARKHHAEHVPGIGRLAIIVGIAAAAMSRADIDAGSIWILKAFKSARQFAVPRRECCGGKWTLPGISKRDSTYRRVLLIHGARVALLQVRRHADRGQERLARLVARRNANIEAVHV